MGRIRVGPHSAGSEPGPACYGRGGLDPTVTDADLVLGKIDPHDFAGGSIALSVPGAAGALEGGIGAALALSAAEAAYGVCEMVDENMANAGRVHAVESGKDLTHFTMITFGGAGPLHAARLCEKMGIGRFIVPPGAGVGSAIGFLRAPFGYEAVRSALLPLSRFDAGWINALVGAMTDEALGFVREGLAGRTAVVERTAFMRYAGQGWDIPVELPDGAFAPGDAAALTARFEAAYARFFGRGIEGLDIEVVSWSVRASSPLPPAVRVAQASSRGAVTPNTTRPVFDAARRGFVDAGLFDRAALVAGDTVEGPAVITERETATVLTSSFTATVQPDGCLLASRR